MYLENVSIIVDVKRKQKKYFSVHVITKLKLCTVITG